MSFLAQKETVKVHVIVVFQVLITEHGDQGSDRDSKGACDCGVTGVDHGTWGSDRNSKGACDCGVTGVDHGKWGPGLRQRQ